MTAAWIDCYDPGLVPDWSHAILDALSLLRTGDEPEQYWVGSRALAVAVRQLPMDAAWATPIRNASQPVVTYGEFLAATPRDDDLRGELLAAADVLLQAIQSIGDRET